LLDRDKFCITYQENLFKLLTFLGEGTQDNLIIFHNSTAGDQNSCEK
jgi:hypothetical protein